MVNRTSSYQPKLQKTKHNPPIGQPCKKHAGSRVQFGRCHMPLVSRFPGFLVFWFTDHPKKESARAESLSAVWWAGEHLKGERESEGVCERAKGRMGERARGRATRNALFARPAGSFAEHGRGVGLASG
jgi:hypothetical protein